VLGYSLESFAGKAPIVFYADGPFTMNFLFHFHPTPADLEEYSGTHHDNNRFIEKIEEHLLLCEPCRGKLDEIEQDIRVLRIVLRQAETCTVVN
jgi:hypothetical protein